MKYIKLYEEYNTRPFFELRLYTVQIVDETETIFLYSGSDKQEANKIYISVNSSDLIEGMKYNCSCLFNIQDNIYEWVGDVDDEIKDYDIEEYYDDDSYYKLIEEGELDTIDSKQIKSNYEEGEELEKNVYNNLELSITEYIKSISKKHKTAAFMGRTFYSLIPYLDGYIQVRVADHFFNFFNINLGKNVIWDYIDVGSKFNTNENIYGFLSIHILDKYSDYYKDKKGFKSDFKSREEYSKYPNLIKIITYDISKDDIEEIDYEYDIDYQLNEIKNEIDIFPIKDLAEDETFQY